MKNKDLFGLKVSDFKKLLNIPENEIMGEVIRLNCTAYHNCLDVLKVCTLIRESKIKA